MSSTTTTTTTTKTTMATPPPPADTDSFPLAAQIPLKSFDLPTFPPQASRLRELTLTADIKLDEYQALLRPGTFEPANTRPPASITHLTLELFSLGFPSPFLTTLAHRLPNLRSLTLFACLVDGINDGSRADADAFFRALPLLKELHVIDTFARPGFWKGVAAGAGAGGGGGGVTLEIVEVSYTYRGHDDLDFLGKVHGEEWVGFIGRARVGVSFNFAPPLSGGPEEMVMGLDGLVAEKEEEARSIGDGILPFASDGRASDALRRRCEALGVIKDLKGLKILNLTMFTLRAVEVGKILYACRGDSGQGGLVDLSASVLMDDGWWEELANGCQYKNAGVSLEGIEIVGIPAKKENRGRI